LEDLVGPLWALQSLRGRILNGCFSVVAAYPAPKGNSLPPFISRRLTGNRGAVHLVSKAAIVVADNFGEHITKLNLDSILGVLIFEKINPKKEL